MDASDRPADCAPLAALLYERSTAPDLPALVAGAAHGSGYAVSHAPEASEGWAEILRDGLTFDLHGLAGGPAQPSPEITAGVGMDRSGVGTMAALMMAPGPHLAGAHRLLPVIRVAANLLLELARIGPAQAIAWLPAKLSIRTDLFEKAVRPWLEGGPFPAPAFVALHPAEDGGLQTIGLNFFTGQEFFLHAGSPDASTRLPRVAIRLVDWLVAHGPVTGQAEAVLAGTGAVFLEARESGRIVARCD